MWLMDRDDVTDAFARWKVAQDIFLATEQRLFEAVGTGAHQFPVKSVHETDPLFIQVQAARAHSERLLLIAMKLLHERRHPAKAPLQAGREPEGVQEPERKTHTLSPQIPASLSPDCHRSNQEKSLLPFR